MTARYTPGLGLGVGLLSIALLGSELLLTRIFSVVIWYHFAFFAISVALFGMGAASIWIHLRQEQFPPKRTPASLARFSLGLALAVVAVDLMLVNLRLGATSTFTHLSPALVAVFLAVALPFFLGGAGLALAMTRYAAHAHRLYFFDLAGAGLACLLTIPLTSVLGGPIALVTIGAVAIAAALVFALAAEPAERGRLAVMAAVVAALVLGVATIGGLQGWFAIKAAKNIDLEHAPPEFNRWNAFSMVTVTSSQLFRGWGMSPNYRGPVPRQKRLVIDMNAMTTLTAFDGNLAGVEHVRHDLSALVYRLKPAPDHVCVIGAGGGKDVLAALASGAKHVTAVEINPLIMNGVVRGQYREFTGGLYDRDDVTPVVEDGRSFLRGSRDRYDVVLLSMVDTSAATAAGAYALTENGLYTVDAFEDFLRRLQPGGILSVSTVSLPGLAVGARLASVSRAALQRLGADPARSIIVAQTGWMSMPHAVLHDFLLKPDGFTPAEVEAAKGALLGLAFRTGYLPGQPAAGGTEEQQWIHTIVTEPDEGRLAATLDTLSFDVGPVTDERPFFFYQDRLRDLPSALGLDPSHSFGNGLAILAKVLVVSLGLVAVFLLLPAVLARGEIRRGTGSATLDLAFASCLGRVHVRRDRADPAPDDVPRQPDLLAGRGPLRTAHRGRHRQQRPRPGAGRERAAAALHRPRRRRALRGRHLGAPAGDLRGDACRGRHGARRGGGDDPRAPRLHARHAAADRRAGRRGARADAHPVALINGGTSVLGSVLATLTSLNAGIPTTLLVGAALYIVACGLWTAVGRLHAEAVVEGARAPAELLTRSAT